MSRSKIGSKHPSYQTDLLSKKKKETRPFRFSYFHLSSIFNTLIAAVLLILFLIIALNTSHELLIIDHSELHIEILIPIVLFSLQIGVTCYNVRRQSITLKPILLYYLFFNTYMTELTHLIARINDMHYLILLQGIIDFYILQIIPQIWIRSLMIFLTGGYYMLRKQEIPSVLGFFCWFLATFSLFAQEFNMHSILKSYETVYNSSNKELKQIKRALQSIPDGVAIIFDNIICYSNYSMQKNFTSVETNDILTSFEEVTISPEETNYYFEHRNVEDTLHAPVQMSSMNPLLMTEKNSEKSSKEHLNNQILNSFEINPGERALLTTGNAKVIDLDLKIKNVENGHKIIEDNFSEVFKELGKKNLRFFINYIQSKQGILGAGSDDSGSTLVLTNCTHPKKGKVFDIKLKRVSWSKDKGAILAIFVDRTIKSNAELLMKANKFKDAVLSYVSHEIKTPLNAMMVNLENIRDSVDEKLANELIKPTINSGHLLQSTVTDLDLISKIERQSFVPKITSFNLRNFMLDIISLFQIQIVEKNLRLDLEISSKVPELIRVSELVLKQLLINLISNSVKYTFKGFIRILVSKELDEEDTLIFTIIDTGIGIKEEDKDKIGRIFSRQTEKRKNFQNTGIGLGLHICTSLIQYLHQDSIDFNSIYGKGTVVTFKAKLVPPETPFLKVVKKSSSELVSKGINTDTFDGVNEGSDEKPVTTINKPQIFASNHAENKFATSRIKFGDSTLNITRSSSKEHTNLVSPGRKEREKFGLLVVDDNQLSILAIKNMLSKSGITIGSAANGEVAIEKILNCAVEELKLIIMDLNMPIMDGIECTKKLRDMMTSKQIPEIPIVMSSAVDEGQSEETLELFEDCLPKPVDRKCLLNIVKQYFPNIS